MNTQQNPSFQSLPQSLRGGRIPFVRFGGSFNMREIKLSQGMSTMVDIEDFEYLNQFTWCAVKPDKIWYAIRSERLANKMKTHYMHRVVMDAKKGELVDHFDSNGLNNCKINLRICTHAQNIANSRKRKNTTSKYKGVSYYKPSDKWVAHICIDKKVKFLGYYLTEIEGAIIYNLTARRYKGKFARLNSWG